MATSKLVLLIASLLFVFLAPQISGAEFHEQSTPLNIKHSVRFQDAPTTSASCNITVFDPDQEILVNFRPMTPNSLSQTYNYTLPASNTSELGDYCYDVTCSLNGINQTDPFCIEVNVTGKDYTIAQSITYFFLFFLSMFFFGVCLYGALTIPKENEKVQNTETGEIVTWRINYKKYLKMLCIVLCYAFLIILSFLGWNISYGLLTFLTIGYLFKMSFYVLIALFIPTLIIIFVIGIQNMMEDKKLMKEWREGFNIQW